MNALILSRYELIKAGFRQALRDVLPACELHQSASVSEAMRFLTERSYELFVFSDDMELDLKEVLLLHPDLRVLLISLQPDSQQALRSIRLGVKGVISADASLNEIGVALLNLVGNHNYIQTRFLTYFLNENEKGSSRDVFHLLSNRERQICQHLADGSSLTHISSQLKLTISTISTYKMKIYRKLGVDSDFKFWDLMSKHRGQLPFPQPVQQAS